MINIGNHCFSVAFIAILIYLCLKCNSELRYKCFLQSFSLPGGGGELPYEEYTGVCHELGSYFQEKIPKRVCQFFTKNPERAVISIRNSR